MTDTDTQQTTPKPLPAIQRRILGVLMEKARTTPDAYPLSLNGLVTGANQKSNRFPIMQLTSEQIEDAIISMRENGIAAEVHGGGRVPKYRHYGSDYLGVKGPEVGVMVELLLRGQQTAGELRTRASRFEPIPDLGALQNILNNLIQRGLVISLTGPGRGQLFTHNLYEPNELELVKKLAASAPIAEASSSSSTRTSSAQEISELRSEIDDLKQVVETLQQRVSQLENPSE